MPNYGALSDPAQVGASLSNSVLQGWQMAKQAKAEQALYGYLQNPTPEAAAAVGMHNPMLGLELKQREDARAEAQRQRDLEAHKIDVQRRAAAGDRGAMAELAGIDINAWDKLSDNEKAEIDERTKYIGQAALRISTMDPAQQPAAWDQAAIYGSQRFPELADYVGKFSPEALQGALDSAGQVKTFLDLTKPSYMAVPYDATLVNTHDPKAVAQFGQGAPQTQQPQSTPAQPQPRFTQVLSPQQFAQAFANVPPQAAVQAAAKAGAAVRVSSPQEAAGLPPGTWVQLPDGSFRQTAGGTAGNGGGGFP